MTTVICPGWPDQSQGLFLFQCETASNDAQLGFHFRFWNSPHAVYTAASWAYRVGDGGGGAQQRERQPQLGLRAELELSSGHSKSSSTDTTGTSTSWEVVQLNIPTFLTLTPEAPQSTSETGTQKSAKKCVYLHHTLSSLTSPACHFLHLYEVLNWPRQLGLGEGTAKPCVQHCFSKAVRKFACVVSFHSHHPCTWGQFCTRQARVSLGDLPKRPKRIQAPWEFSLALCHSDWYVLNLQHLRQ